jgi:hypothetical protein
MSKYKYHTLLLLFVLSAGQRLFAQKGQILLAVDPPNSIIYIGDKKYHSSAAVQSLDTGFYQLKGWTRGYQLYQDTIHVTARPKIVKVKLVPTPEYLAYKAEKSTLNGLRALFIGAPAIALGVFYKSNTANYHNNLALIDQYQVQSEEALAGYRAAVNPKEIELFQIQYEIASQNYNTQLEKNRKLVRRYNIGMSTGIALITSGIVWSIVKKNPKYTQEPLLSRMQVYPAVSLTGTTEMCLNYRFK